REAAERGILQGAEPLAPTTTATTVRMHNGEALVTDGPFAETKEQLAGYYILECENLDDAIEWAAKIPTCCKGVEGCVEIRPMPGVPPPSESKRGADTN
ncbi:MAG: YciI family protein, partial [Bryobacteraceae bacterium]